MIKVSIKSSFFVLLLLAGCLTTPDPETKKNGAEEVVSGTNAVNTVQAEINRPEEPLTSAIDGLLDIMDNADNSVLSAQPIAWPANQPGALELERTTVTAETAQVEEIMDELVIGSELPTIVIDEFTVNKDIRLGSVLRSLARIADVNIVFGDSVEDMGPFRFRLNNPTPWNEVLNSILSVYHLNYEMNGRIITIMTLDDMNQRYAMEKQKSDQLDLAIRKEAMTPLILKVMPVKYLKAELLVEPFMKILQQSAHEEGGEIRGSISADKSSNNLIVHAPPADLEKVDELLRIMDHKTRQVRIEAALVEVSYDFAYEMGVKWSFHGNANLSSPTETRSPAAVSPMSMDQEGNFQLTDATYKTMQGLVDTATGSLDYGIMGRDFAIGMNLQALEEDGKLKILSRPSLTTMDNQKAIIKSGSDIPFRTEDDEGRPVVEYKEAVLSLDVVPQIIDDVAIFMDVAITKDEPDFSQTVDGNPLVLKKFIESRMIVLDGQTAVIGGLTKDSDFNRDGGIPYLRKIPFIGRLFSSKSKQQSAEELMIFLTPRIVPNSALDNSEIIEEWMNEVYYKDGKSLTDRQRGKANFTNVDFLVPSATNAVETTTD